MLCSGCESDLPWHDGPQCPVCALPTGTGDMCGHCLKTPPAFDATHALLEYRFPVNAVLQRYKYAGFLHVARLMGELFAQKFADISRPDILLPMPLHPGRLKERGFNQAVEIGRTVSKQLHLRMEPRFCARIRSTPPQAGLSLKDRRLNVKGIFACNRRLDGQHVAVLDDVMTTGASLDALARALKDAGAARVDCWVIARTLPE